MRIVFTPAIAGKPWQGSTIYEEALGGSEAAVVYLARELARRDHEVAVYTHGQPGTYEDVRYLHVSQLQQEGVPQCDVHVSSRWIEVHYGSPARLKVLWLHDMPYQAPQLGADLVVCISEFQAQAWGILGHPGVEVSSDGVDLTLFSGEEKRDENRLVWISNPDRGLYIACKVFCEDILPRWPDLHLDIFGRAAVYGWGPEAERWHMPTVAWLESGKITLREPLPRLGLARELMRSWAMWYPTYWPETFCMAALEAQAAGTPVIASPVGALMETVKGGVLTEDLANAVSQLRNKSRWKKLSEAGKAHAGKYSWALVAGRWENFLTRRLKGGGQ